MKRGGPLRRRTPLRRSEFRRRDPRTAAVTPAWADHDAIRAVYREARDLAALTGQPHHVDHIVPLRHADVCGLHVADNLRAVPAWFNLEKSNRWRNE